MTKKPTNKTNRPLFSSGPCAKFPNWQINKIETSILGRSHRAKKPKDFINYSVELTSELLEIPKDYKVAIVPHLILGHLRWQCGTFWDIYQLMFLLGNLSVRDG